MYRRAFDHLHQHHELNCRCLDCRCSNESSTLRQVRPHEDFAWAYWDYSRNSQLHKILLLQLLLLVVSYVSNEVENSSILNLLRKSFMPYNTLVHAIIMIVIIVSISKLYKRYMELNFLVSEGKVDFCDFVGQALVTHDSCLSRRKTWWGVHL